jgi:hypothetical protein
LNCRGFPDPLPTGAGRKTALLISDCGLGEGDPPAEPRFSRNVRLGGSLALPITGLSFRNPKSAMHSAFDIDPLFPK